MSIHTPPRRIEVPEEPWYQSAASDERLRLFTAPTVVAFLVAMLAALWLALPGRTLADRLAQAGRGDPLTVAYLRAWLAAKPDDLPLYLTLARQHLLLGDFDRAVRTLDPLIARGSGPIRQESAWLKLDALERKAFATPEGSETRTEALAALARHLRSIVADDEALAPLGPRQVLDLLARATAIGERGAAATLLATLAGREPPAGEDAARWHAQLAATAMSLGDSRLAASLHWKAFDASASDGERRNHFFAAIRILQAADRTADALEQADARFSSLSPDTGLYRFMVRLAQAAGKLDIAERYARAMLRFSLWQQWQAATAQTGQAAGDAHGARVRPVALQRAASAAEPVPGGDPGTEDVARQPKLPFDDATYLLAFQVFVANRNLADAFEVASSAVRQAPASLEWRRRLAQVAEWTARPQVALEQWRAIARATGDAQTWSRVEQLATALSDVDTLLEAMQFRARRGGTEQLELQIAQAHETLGQPALAIDWLQARIRARGIASSPLLLARLLRLLEDTGDEQALLSWLDQADQAMGPDPARALRRAAIHYQRGELARAFDALAAVRERVLAMKEAPALDDPASNGYWALYAELARLLQRDAEAEFAYRQMLRTERYTPTDVANYSALLEHSSLAAAALTAEFAWRRFGQTAQAERAFGLWLQLRNFERIERLSASMDPATVRRLRAEVGFLQAWSAHLQAIGDEDGARRALEQALAAAPNDAQLQAGYLWLVIAQRKPQALRSALRRWEAAAEREPALWGPFAAAWMALDEPPRALRYYVKQSRGSQDYLWQLGYADCLEQNGLVDTAWSVRRRAWIELRSLPPEQLARAPPLRQATVTLALRFAPADAARDVLWRFVGEQEAALASALAARPDAGGSGAAGARPVVPRPGDAAQSGAAADPRARVTPPRDPRTGAELLALVDAQRATSGSSSDAGEETVDDTLLTKRSLAASSRELATSWLLSQETHEAARAWLLSRYADRLSRPAWAQLSVALAADDRQALSTLLDELPDWLPRLESIDALRATGAPGAAQSLAFETLAQRPALEAAHQRFVEHTLPDASFVELGASGGKIGALGLRTLGARAQLRPTPGLKLGLVVETDRQRSVDETQLVNVPAVAGLVAATLRWRSDAWQTEAALTHRQAVLDYSGLAVAIRPAADADSGPQAALGLRQLAPQSAPLRVGGMQDFGLLRYGLVPAPDTRVWGTVVATRLLSQDGSQLGTGTQLSLEAAHRLRRDYPDLSIKAALVRANWRSPPVTDPLVASLVPSDLGDPTAAVIPASSTEASIGVAFGETVSNTYSRALRPFGEVALRANSVTGGGYNVRFGATTSVFGTDRFSAFLNLISPTPGVPGTTREFGLLYQFLF